MDQTIKNNNEFLLLASESSKLINETAGKIDTDTGPGSESENETETKISLLSPNLSVRNKGYEIKFNVKKINEITEIATCDFSKGYLFPIKTHSVSDYDKIKINEDEGNDEGIDEVSTEYTVSKINSSGETESFNEKMYTLHLHDTLDKNTGIYLTDSQKNDILVNNSIAFTHKKKD